MFPAARHAAVRTAATAVAAAAAAAAPSTAETRAVVHNPVHALDASVVGRTLIHQEDKVRTVRARSRRGVRLPSGALVPTASPPQDDGWVTVGEEHEAAPNAEGSQFASQEIDAGIAALQHAFNECVPCLQDSLRQ